jgi:PLP dependent protein
MNNNLDCLKENIVEICTKISDAAGRTGRKPEDITLVAVSKTFSSELVRQAFSLGIRDFGESYVQEAVDKIDSLDLDIKAKWHFIGQLQKNKVKPVVKRFNMIQSVDSVKLLQRIKQDCRRRR